MTDWRLPDPVPVREVENTWVYTPDGARLALSLWLPDVDRPVPVVLEAIPYRKRDSTYLYARAWGRQLAQYGVAYARLDLRGSGDSGGLLSDEYLRQEQADADYTIGWLSAQSWCNGQVGMRGVSWGGFATLQAAALAPSALKAVMVMCASDRRYTDDAHYVGGAFALTGLKWATSFKLVVAGPPDPAVYGPDWEAAWRARLESAPPIMARWLSHSREDDYWRQGSVAANYARVKCPAYLVGGWADPYNAAIPRLLANLSAPTKALIGPWGHGYPWPAGPGPGLDWIVEEVRWWRHWLMGETTGIMDEPRVRAFLPEASPAEVAPGAIPGNWIAEAAWPVTANATSLRLTHAGLRRDRGEGIVDVVSDVAVGLASPEWCPFAAPQYPAEQSADDARSRVFDSEPLEAPLDFFGTPRLAVSVAASAPVATFAARLTEVTPDGRSWLVSYGVLNLTHRDSHASPQPLEPGVFYDVALDLYPAARRFRPGSRIRLALSEGLWPLLWPSPEPVTLRIDLASAWLRLPVRSNVSDEAPFLIPLEAPAPRAGRGDPVVERNVGADGEVTFREVWPVSRALVEGVGTTVERSGANVELSVRRGDPSSCRWRAWQLVRYQRDNWDCALEAEVEVTADGAEFHVRERFAAYRSGEQVFMRQTTSSLPRDLM